MFETISQAIKEDPEAAKRALQDATDQVLAELRADRAKNGRPIYRKDRAGIGCWIGR